MKYVMNKSGYCYKIEGNKKIRISKNEYNQKTQKKKTGGQFDTIHPSNLPDVPSKQIHKCATQKCNKCPNMNSRIQCINRCTQ